MQEENLVSRQLVWPNQRPPAFAGVWPTDVALVDCRRPIRVESQDFFCIHLVLSGTLQFVVDGKVQTRLRARDMFMTCPGEKFYYIGLENGDTNRLFWLRLIGPLVGEFFEAMGFSRTRFHFKAADSRRAREIFLHLLGLAETYGKNADIETLALIYQLIGAAGYAKGAPTPNKILVEQVRQFMEDEVDKGLNIQQICAAFQISRSGLFLKFKQEFGISPVEYLESVRLKRAKQLLRGTDLAVKRIALRAGYSGQIHFIRHFKKIEGVPPGEWRTRNNTPEPCCQ